LMYIVLEHLDQHAQAMINLLLAVYAATIFPLFYTALTSA